MIKPERSTPFQGALLGKQLITRRLSATADGGIASPVWSVREQGNKAARQQGSKATRQQGNKAAGQQGSREDIRGVILAAFCCLGCPPGHFKSRSCVLLRPPLSQRSVAVAVWENNATRWRGSDFLQISIIQAFPIRICQNGLTDTWCRCNGKCPAAGGRRRILRGTVTGEPGERGVPPGRPACV